MNGLLDDPQPAPVTTARTPRRRRHLLRRLDGAVVSVAVRTGVSPRAVIGVALLTLAIVVVLAIRAVAAHRAGQPVSIAPAPAGVVRLASASPAPSSIGSIPTNGSIPSSGPARLVVHVVGQVHHPGVVVVAAGSRVQDAVRAAGGVTKRADVAAVNLARPLVDGEQIVVPRPGEAGTPAGPAPSAGAGPGGGADRPTTTSPVGLNTATAEQLDTLPGVGPVLAARIIDFRTEHGRFTSVEELGEVSGIGDKVLERLRPLVRL